MSYRGQRRAGLDALILREPRVHLLTTDLPKPRLAAGVIRARMMSLGQLGHEAKAASSYRTEVGGHGRR
jgi:hypothetical protein